MSKNIAYDFNDKEKEICAFLSVIETLNNATNKRMLYFSGPVNNITIQAKGVAEEKLFMILSADLLIKVGQIFSDKNINILEVLRCISDDSLLTGTELIELKQVIQAFLDWLNEKSSYSNIYFASKNLDLSLDISNANIIRICGNSVKHNLNHLDAVRKTLLNVLEENHISDVVITNKDLVFLLQEFNANFWSDNGYIYKYINCLAYFMNELRWAIYNSLKPVFDSHYVGKKTNGINGYEYLETDDLSDVGFGLFRELMEEQYCEPSIPRFNILNVWLRPNTYVFDQSILEDVLKFEV